MQMQRVVQHIDDGHVTAEDCRLLGLDSKVSMLYTDTHTNTHTHTHTHTQCVCVCVCVYYIYMAYTYDAPFAP